LLNIRKRTGWIFFWVMLPQLLLVSWQVQTKSGTRLLQAMAFEVFSRVQSGTASVVSGTRGMWGNYVALRGVRVENEDLKRRVAALEVQLQQEHALAARSTELQKLMDLRSQALFPTLAAEVIAGNPDPVMRTVTIDKGSTDGVLADMAVVAPGGIVGRVIAPVGRRAARVQPTSVAIDPAGDDLTVTCELPVDTYASVLADELVKPAAVPAETAGEDGEPETAE